MNELIFNRALKAFLAPFNLLPQSPVSKVKIKRLLLSQIAHLGDVALATSLIPALKYHYPDVRISFLVASQTKALIEDHEDIEKIYTFDHPLLKRGSKSLSWPLKELRNFDAAIDLSPYFPNSLPLLFCAQIPMRIGFTSGGFGKWLTHPIQWNFDKRHLIEKLGDLLTPLNISGYEPVYHLPIKPIQSHIPYWVIQAKGGAPHKEWPLEHWRQILSLLKGERVVMIGQGGDQRDFAARLVKEEDNLCGKLSLHELKVLIAGARAFIGVDSIGGHLAAAYKIPSITLYHPRDDMSLWRPYFQEAYCFPLSSPPEALYTAIDKVSPF